MNITPTLQLNVVSLEAKIFTGPAMMVVVTGALGEMCVLPGHIPLITAIQPGQIRITLLDGKQDVYYISGGIMEVLPTMVTVLADSVIHSADLDEAAAIAAREAAKNALTQKQANINFTDALAQMTQATAKLRTIKLSRKGK